MIYDIMEPFFLSIVLRIVIYIHHVNDFLLPIGVKKLFSFFLGKLEFYNSKTKGLKTPARQLGQEGPRGTTRPVFNVPPTLATSFSFPIVNLLA
jgi:hypothetical protein